MNWIDMQKQYFDALQALGYKMNDTSSNGNSVEQWTKAIEFWWKNNKLDMSALNLSTFQKLLSESQSFYFIGQQLSNILSQINSASSSSSNEQWITVLTEQFEQLKKYLRDQANVPNYPFSFAEVVNNPFFESITQSFAHQSAHGFMNVEHFNSDWFDSLDSAFKMQPLGYSREIQQKLQQNVLLFKEFQIASQAYNEAMLKVSLDAVDKLKEELTNKAYQDEKIESLKQLYDLWVDCNENSYAEYAMTQEYSERYGQMVNTLMAYRSQSNELMEELMSALNLPTQSDLTALVEQQYKMNQRLKNTEVDSNAYQKEIKNLESEVKRLHSEINRLKNAVSSISEIQNQVKSTAKKKVRKKAVAKEKVVNIKSLSGEKGRSKTEESKKKIEIKF